MNAEMAEIANVVEFQGNRRYERYCREIYIFKKENRRKGEV